MGIQLNAYCVRQEFYAIVHCSCVLVDDDNDDGNGPGNVGTFVLNETMAIVNKQSDRSMGFYLTLLSARIPPMLSGF